jgi:parallel beta-helix repeat protein
LAQSTESIAILNNTISSFKKSGIVVKDALSVQIEGNTISTTDHSLAPNGIQIGYVMDYTATTGTVNDNQISGCYWDGYDPETMVYEDDWTGSGILVIAPNSALTISGNEVQNSDVGLDIEADSGTAITNNDVHDNSYGFVLWNDDPTINYNSISGNALGGVYRTSDTTGVLDAKYNWWGDASGPSGAGLGSGDAVSANVDYSSWLGKLLNEVRGTIAGLPDSAFKKQNAAGDQRQALIDKIDAVYDQFDDGAYRGALNKLERDIAKRIEKWIEEDAITAWELMTKVNAEIDILEGFVP